MTSKQALTAVATLQKFIADLDAPFAQDIWPCHSLGGEQSKAAHSYYRFFHKKALNTSLEYIVQTFSL
jgi:hypothetical protein